MEKLNQRGRSLEAILNKTHQNYRNRRRASIYKVPVLQMLNTNQFFKRAHYFCDFVGCYQSYYLEFEAKETYRSSFHWSQMRKSQRYKMQQVSLNKGLSFIIIYFGIHNQFWLLFYEDLKDFISQNSQTISYQDCQKLGSQITITNDSILDYLPLIAKKIASRRDNFS